MKFTPIATALALTGLVAGCGKHEPRATTYFAAHLDEARKVVTDCQSGSARGEECANAGAAVQEADARERFKRFRGK
jgi:hypothetical protein